MTGGSVIRNVINMLLPRPIIPPKPLTGPPYGYLPVGPGNETISPQGSIPAQILHNPPVGVKKPRPNQIYLLLVHRVTSLLVTRVFQKKNYLYII